MDTLPPIPASLFLVWRDRNASFGEVTDAVRAYARAAIAAHETPTDKTVTCKDTA